MPVKPLNELKNGEKGRIVKIGGGKGLRQRFLEWHGERGRMARMGSRRDLRHRLLDMGLVPGSEVEMERVAPLGDPIEVKVKGYNLSLRKEEASGIQVEVT